MKLPAKIEYACKAAVELATKADTHKPVRISVIAKTQNIPQKYLVQLMIRLKNAGVAKSIRGVMGGYMLAKPAAEIRLYDIFRAVDRVAVEPTRGGRRGRETAVDTIMLEVWEGMNKHCMKQLQSITIAQIAGKIKGAGAQYHI